MEMYGWIVASGRSNSEANTKLFQLSDLFMQLNGETRSVSVQ